MTMHGSDYPGFQVARYRLYMRRRGYVQETVWARGSIASEWCQRLDWRAASFHDVEEWLAERNLTAGSTRNLHANLRAWYRWAMREGLCDRDPTILVDLPRLPRRLPRPARDEHIGHVLAGADDELAAMIGLMAGAGLRCVELARLDWPDVDLASARVTVMGKGLKERTLDLSPNVVALLARLEGIAGPVFRGVKGGRLSPARVSQRVCRAFRAAGYPTTAHQLRHRFASKALEDPAADLLAVRDLLGHSSVATTQIYTALAPGRSAQVCRGVTLPPAA
jgi:site-specific recombinase XerC